MEIVSLPSGHTFRIHSVEELFKKLWRERERLEKGQDIYDRFDAVMNFAVTAWHMVDWCVKGHPAIVKKVCGKAELGPFRKYLLGECPELRACDVIANAAKHGGVADAKPGRPTVGSELLSYVHGGERVVELNVIIDGKSVPAETICSQVSLFWHRFLQKHVLAGP